MSVKLTFLLPFICLILHRGSSEEVTYHGHQVWRVVPMSDQVLQILRRIGDTLQLDFWNDPVAIGRPVYFRVTPNQVDGVSKSLVARGIRDYQVSIPDVQLVIDSQRREHQQAAARQHGRVSSRTLSDFDYSIYHELEEINDWMDMVVEEFPDAVDKKQIGTTYQGRQMFTLEFTKESTSPRPIIFVDALIHCREWVTTASLMWIFKEMLLNTDYSDMMNDVDWYFVPMVNIDGYVETWTGDRLWRKTKATGASSRCHGIDGNRNFDSHWSYPGASADPCSIFYYGPTPLSESETRHLANYALGLGVGKIDSFITTHSYSQLILYPYGWTFDPTADDMVQNITGKLMSDAIRKVHGKEYVYGPSASTIYQTSGTTQDWAYDVAKSILTYTYELRDTGEYAFLLPADQIIPTAQEYLAGLKALKDSVVDLFNSR